MLEGTQECWRELRIPGGRVISGEDDPGEDDFWRNAVECGWLRFSGYPFMLLSTPACWSTSCGLVLDGGGCLPW